MRANPIRIVALLALTALLAACSQSPTSAPPKKDPPGMVSISPVPPKPGVALSRFEAFPNPTLVASQGDCAPHYANGERGACINNKPCRGLGVQTAAGGAECRCYVIAGGCREDERCDIVRKTCVSEKAPGPGRGESD